MTPPVTPALIAGLQDMHDRMRDGFSSAEPHKALLREAIDALAQLAAVQAGPQWIAWSGAEEPPVEDDVVVTYRLRGEGDEAFVNVAGHLMWHHDGGRDDIVAYHVFHSTKDTHD